MSSRGNDALLRCGAAAGLLLAGCMLGGDGEDEQSPYENAEIRVPNPVGAADGLTGILVEVTTDSDTGSRLVLEVIGNGSFLNPDPGHPTEKTVFLAEDDNGVLRATAEVISARPGEVVVAFKPDPLQGARTIRFLPVVFDAGTPEAVRLHPGLVETEICFAVNTAQGVLATNVLIDLEAPPEGTVADDPPPSDVDEGDGEDDWAEAPAPGVQATAQISAQAPDGLDCPAADAALDEIGWKGYAKMFVRTDLVHAGLSLDYRTAIGSPNLYNREVELFLDPFPGYVVTVNDPVPTADYVEVLVHVDYQSLGDIGGGAAGDVEITQRCIPDCPELLGTSAGGVDDPIVTDANGDVTLFFDPLGTGTYVWYLNLSGDIEQRMVPDLTF